MMAEKLYYTMGEVAELFDVNQSLIRHWETQFSILRPKRNKKGNRLFTPQDLEHLKMIYHLVKERGMTLEGARKALRKAPARGGVDRDAELMERLQQIRALLVEVREELKPDDRGVVVAEAAEEVEPVESAAAEPVEIPAEEPVAPEAPEAESSGWGAEPVERPTEESFEPVAGESVAAESFEPVEMPVADEPVEWTEPAGLFADEADVRPFAAEPSEPFEPVDPPAAEPSAVRPLRARPVVRIDEQTDRPIDDEAPRTAVRKPRPKKDDADRNELFAFYEQSLF